MKSRKGPSEPTTNRFSFALPLALSLALMVGGTANAEETEIIPLSRDEAVRMRLVFQPARSADLKDGNSVPATVINSPEHSSQAIALYSGTLTRWHLMPGDTVTAGQPVATLSSPELMAVEESWLKSHNNLEQARYELERDDELLKEGIIANQRLQQTRRRFQQAEFTQTAYRQQLTRAGFTQADLEQLASGSRQPGEYQVKSPATGTLSERLYNAGQAVTANTPVATLQAGAELWLEAAVPNALAASLDVGDRLQLARSDDVVVLKYKNSAVNPTTQMVDIMAALERPQGYLPGQTLMLTLPPLARGVLVPAAAVTHSGGATTVYVRRENGVEARAISLLPMGNHYLATDGIAPGEELVVEGAALLKGIQLGLGGGE
ncbi:efflux RND transporter periplasmic adaptor subunit [Alcanivorax jadensis]|uniref:efflux RND transporter periplasmic adaptor subunit n=1 Tax=Alcanivorax jadensis TaxID=64988 RepID=UPI00240A6E74|nr:efflux RND transporter periplasmic adaptor subunit [Alcanivorax jadensis]MDF1639301.1 efflux RND transporter periplasmic adaptor subunit [Alcanivorax jadensis]